MVMNLVRRCNIEVIYKNKDITEKLTPYLQSVTVVDNLEGVFDSLEIKLLNKNNLFMGKGWSFQKGDLLKITATTLNWENEYEGEKRFNLGEFYIDEKEFDKYTARIKAISAPLNATDTTHDKTWENIQLKSLGQEIANKYKLKYQFLSDDINFSNLQQERQTDFQFLKNTAEESDVKVKITNEKLVLFDESKLPDKIKKHIQVDLLKVIDFKLRDTKKTTYDSVELSHFDVIKLKDVTYVKSYNELKGLPGGTTNKVLKLKKRPSTQNIEKYAIAQIEKANRTSTVLEITDIGNGSMYSGCVIEVLNSGEFNGKYLVKKITKTFPQFKMVVEAYKL